MNNEYLSMELTVQDVYNLIEEIERLRVCLSTNNLSEKDKEDIRYFLAMYIGTLRNRKVIV